MIRSSIFFIFLCLFSFPALAQLATDIPSTVDAGRIDKQKQEPSVQKNRFGGLNIPKQRLSEAPAGSGDIKFVLKDVRVEGSSVFKTDDFLRIYASSLGREITLDKVWDFANGVTQLYRAEGYFLSRAYIPAQNIADGIVSIKVVEGFIGEVSLDETYFKKWVIDRSIKGLLAERPVKAGSIESFLLRLDDLPGMSFRAVLTPIKDPVSEEGGVKLVLEAQRKPGRGTIRLDNLGSRFMGPNEALGYYEASFLPLQQTSLSVLTSIPPHELKNGALTHSIVLTPSLILELNGSMTKAIPGYTLEQYDLKSQSVSWETALIYQWIRQREENLSLRVTFGGRNTTSNLAYLPYTRDRIMAIRVGLAYDAFDNWHGSNTLNATLSRGIDGLGSSEENDPFLSRAAAEPDFTKLEAVLSRLQGLPGDFLLYGRASGQVADGPLFSSEEFGYGGQAFGRAYDSSEITGDSGIAASLELRYAGWQEIKPVGFTPYVFYDIGKVWNRDAGQEAKASAASAGLGLRFDLPYSISGEMGASFPLTRSIDNPLYGNNGKNPRLIFQITKSF